MPNRLKVDDTFYSLLHGRNYIKCHVRGRVDDHTVYRWWSSRRCWKYEVISDDKFEDYREHELVSMEHRVLSPVVADGELSKKGENVD
jgi:hypothetical protein